MAFYSYKNCKILINNIPYYVQSASLSEENAIEPGYNLDNKYNINYSPANGIGGNFNISYLLTGQDPLIDYISLDEVPIQVNFGGMYFHKGYLRNYGFNLEPTQPLNINAQIVFFDTLSGNFVPNYEEISNKNCLNTAEVQVSHFPGSATLNINNITQLNYQYNVDIQPHYSIGDTVPNRVVFGPREVSCDITSDKINSLLSVSGNAAFFRIKLIHPTNSNIYQNIDVRGMVNKKDFGINSNSILDNKISIQQNNLENFNSQSTQNIPSPVVYFIQPSSGYYGTAITLSGNNFDYVNYLSVRNGLFTNFEKVNNNQINFYLPDEAISGPITLYTSGNAIETNDSFFVGGLPITISDLILHTGFSSNNIIISGNNFYEISRVIFSSGQESEFSIIDDNLISATIPQNAFYGKIKVVSDLFGISGESSELFSPFPNILGFYPLSGFTGDYITISGFGFEGVGGIKINNLPASSSGVFTVTNNTGISLQVPSGNTYGQIRLYGTQGVSTLSKDSYYPYALITGITPASGRTGEALRISGRNFLPELLYNFGSDKYVVSFRGGVSGDFALINNSTVLTGLVPYGAKSGIIKIFSSTLNEYPSSFSYVVRSQPPSLSQIVPLSGKTGDFISVIGENLLNINNLIITGLNTGYNFSSSEINTSISENYVNFQLPAITGGQYSVRINTIEGNTTGSGLFIMQPPRVSGFSPTSGGAGSIITLTGLDIYPFLTQVWIDGSGYQAALNTGSLNYNNNTVQFYLPSNIASGHHKIIAYNFAGSGSGSYPLNFLPIPSPSGFYPLSGQWGDNILISGSYFDLVNNVSVYNTGGNFSIVGSTGINFTIPDNTITDYIKINNSVGFNYTNNKLLIVPPLVIFSGMSPTEGYYNSGVLITGNHLNTIKEIQFSGITGGSVSAPDFTGINNTGLYLTVPGGVVSGRIRLINDRGATYTNGFDIISGAQILLLSNYTGVFKDSLLISGKFLSGSLVYFGGRDGIVLADNISRINDTGIYFNVPSGIISDRIIVKGRNHVTVLDTGIFTVFPTISGISGANSYATGGYITITGINFNVDNIVTQLGISGNNGAYYNIANTNEFSGTYKTGYSLITAKINDSFAGSGKLFLISEYDTNLSFNSFTGSQSYVQKNKIVFNTPTTISQPAPIISSFSPTGASYSGILTINGMHLFSTLNVNFTVGGISSVGNIISTGNTQIQVRPPNIASGTGLFIVNSSFGSATSGLFRVLIPLFISGYTPLTATTGTYVRISGQSFLSATGVSFGSYNADFIVMNELGTTILSGRVPQADCCGENVLICVRNESENSCL